jgi:hypothetical protein
VYQIQAQQTGIPDLAILFYGYTGPGLCLISSGQIPIYPQQSSFTEIDIAPVNYATVHFIATSSQGNNLFSIIFNTNYNYTNPVLVNEGSFYDIELEEIGPGYWTVNFSTPP